MERQEFERLARFNKFDLTPEEGERILAHLEQTLAELAPLAQADLGDAPPMVYAQGVVPVYREDQVNQTISREAILAGAPEQADHCFAVPRVAE